MPRQTCADIAPTLGIEPRTFRLTAGRIYLIELRWNDDGHVMKIGFLTCYPLHYGPLQGAAEIRTQPASLIER